MMKTKQKILLLAIFLWLAMIWFMSAQPGDLSADTSSQFRQWLLSLLDWWPQGQTVLAELLQLLPIRKIAHFVEYAVLGILFFLYFAEDRVGTLRKHSSKWALLFCFVSAVMDEFHQLYVPGRDGKIVDVLLDTAGSFTGILLIYWISKKMITGEER